MKNQNKRPMAAVPAANSAPAQNQVSKEQEALIIFEQLKRARGLNLTYDEFTRVDGAINTLRSFVALHQPGNPEVVPAAEPAAEPAPEAGH
jgi:hypothetical protein